jgi:hypothetical protein
MNINNQNHSDENRATPAILQNEIKIFNKLCSVCNSGIVKQIHDWRPTHTLDEMVALAKKDYNITLSRDAIARHFKHYTHDLTRASALALWEKFSLDVETVATHQKKVLFISNIAFEHILERLDNGSLTLGVDDFEKMVKLYYSVLRDPDSAGDQNIIAIFQKASEKYGCSLEQGVLIKTKNDTQ